MSQKSVTIWIDGACRGNPGMGAAGMVALDWNGKTTKMKSFFGKTTNNQAEYLALIEALHYAIREHYEEVEIMSDSQLVVKQMNGEFAVRSANVIGLYTRAKILTNTLRDNFTVTITYIPREENIEADKLANEALDESID